MSNKIIIKGARENNLKNLSLEFPRDKLVIFTGLSGSGKSSLVNGIINPVLSNKLNGAIKFASGYDKIEGIEYISSNQNEALKEQGVKLGKPPKKETIIRYKTQLGEICYKLDIKKAYKILNNISIKKETGFCSAPYLYLEFYFKDDVQKEIHFECENLFYDKDYLYW